MSSAKLAVACALAALALAACGTSSKPVAGSVTGTASKPAGRGVVDDPRAKHLKCLLAHHLPAVNVGRTSSDALPGIQIGAPDVGPKVRFEPTPGSAQEAQITNQVESAEVIGSALLYPNRASDQELQIVEDCLAQGVTG